MASIANQNNNVDKMDIRGVKIQVLQDISKRLNEFNVAERVFYKGNSAIKLANEHQFGNGVAIFTNQGSKAREFVHSVEVGMVGINVAIPVPLSFYTFGGWKDSIFGSSNIYGMDGIRFFTRTKTVTARWVDDDGSINLSMPTVK